MMKEEWPSSFKSFLDKAVSLGRNRYSIDKHANSQNQLKLSAKGMSPKKLHEIERMATFLKAFLEANDCHYVIDVGSGLAYLDLALARHGFEIIGLEIDSEKVSKANEIAHLEGLNGNFKSFQMEFKSDEDSLEKLEKLVKTKWCLRDVDKICLVGLHCCGDLSPSMIKTFLEVQSFNFLIFFGCCYHSMKIDGEYFENFPLSNKYSFLKGNFNCFSLRLGAQQTRSSWKNQSFDDHRTHALNVSFRSILELATKKCHFQFKKLKRKLAQVTSESSFESYLIDAITRSTIGESVSSEDILALYKEYERFNEFIEPFTMFQVLFQPIIEFLVLEDRCDYIREFGHNCKLIQLFEDETSPRNCAIVALKQ